MCENCNSKTWNGEWSGFSIPKEKTNPATKDTKLIMANKIWDTNTNCFQYTVVKDESVKDMLDYFKSKIIK